MESSQQELKRNDTKNGDLFLALLSLARLAAKLTLLASRSFSSVSEIDLIMMKYILYYDEVSVCLSVPKNHHILYGVSVTICNHP